MPPEQTSGQSADPNQQGFLHSLTGLRFYAAFAVFLSHLELFNYFVGVSNGAAMAFMKGLGAVGVSVFFVLSGFVLFINYLAPGKQARFSLGRFYAARFARIYPMFFFATLFALPLVAFSLNDPVPGFSLVANLTMLNSILPGIGFINIPAWTINVEAFFYALFPLLALVFRGRIRRNIILLVSAFVVFRVITHWAFPHSEYLAAEYFPPNRVLEFFTGMGLGYAYTRLPEDAPSPWGLPFNQNNALRWHLLAAALLLLLVLRPLLESLLPVAPGPFYYYLYLPFSAGLILLLALLDRHGQSPVLLVHPWIILGGEISYAFYLLHRSVMLYGVRAVEHLNFIPTALPLQVGLLVGILLFVLCIGLSYASYQWIEKPCRKIIRTLWDRLAESSKSRWTAIATYRRKAVSGQPVRF